MMKKYTFLFLCFLFNSVCFGNNAATEPTMPPCSIPAPTNISDCSTPIGSVVLGGLPSGNWTLTRIRNGSPNTIITGSGPTYTDTGLLHECYTYSVADSNGCTSIADYVCVGYLYGLSGTMTGTYVDYNNDGSTNIGDIIRYNLSITNGTICPVDVEYSLDGMTIDGTVTNLAVGATDTSGIVNYVLTQADINSGTVFNWIGLYGTSPNGATSYDKVLLQDPFQLPISDGIRLNPFYDYNNNGVQNSGEPFADNVNLTYSLNNGVVNGAWSSNGQYIIYETNPANSYTLGCYVYNYCTGQFYVSTTSYTNVQVAVGSGITTYNFPIIQNPCQDIEVSLYGGSLRPGFNYINYIYYHNVGNQALASGTVSFTKNNALTITNISEPAAVMTPTGFTYSFTNLLPNQWKDIQVTMSVPPIPTVALGDLMTNSVTITTPPADVNPSNNSDTMTRAVSNSYDPNDKKENHGGKIVYSTFTSNDYLTYTIRFENTGNANAINIRVNDILDNKLDETSIRMVKSSHPCVLHRINNNLNWIFNGINLPPSPSASSTIGHGYIVFKIKLKPGYAIGDIIPNTASIYFDANPPIVTAACLTELVQALNNDTLVFEDFEFYPNPAKNYLILTNSKIMDTVEINSILGQQVKSVKVNDLQAQINLEGLTSGIYFVKIKSEGQQKTIKIIKD